MSLLRLAGSPRRFGSAVFGFFVLPAFVFCALGGRGPSCRTLVPGGRLNRLRYNQEIRILLEYVFAKMGTMVFATVCIAVLGLPLANVAETCEHDVVRAPNSPVVVQRAQKHFGQQLLAHPRTLKGGFRMGGTATNVRVFSLPGSAGC